MAGAEDILNVMTHGKILVVDDDPGFLTALSKTLMNYGHAVTSAADATEAVEALRKRKDDFDLMITDLSMPMINGLEVLKAVKRAFPRLEVIVITAYGDQVTQTNALREGAYAFVQKPMDVKEFLAVVARAIEAEQLQTLPKREL
jgi:two-component system NtrC family response regulator